MSPARLHHSWPSDEYLLYERLRREHWDSINISPPPSNSNWGVTLVPKDIYSNTEYRTPDLLLAGENGTYDAFGLAETLSPYMNLIISSTQPARPTINNGDYTVQWLQQVYDPNSGKQLILGDLLSGTYSYIKDLKHGWYFLASCEMEGIPDDGSVIPKPDMIKRPGKWVFKEDDVGNIYFYILRKSPYATTTSGVGYVIPLSTTLGGVRASGVYSMTSPYNYGNGAMLSPDPWWYQVPGVMMFGPIEIPEVSHWVSPIQIKQELLTSLGIPTGALLTYTALKTGDYLVNWGPLPRYGYTQWLSIDEGDYFISTYIANKQYHYCYAYSRGQYSGIVDMTSGYMGKYRETFTITDFRETAS